MINREFIGQAMRNDQYSAIYNPYITKDDKLQSEISTGFTALPPHALMRVGKVLKVGRDKYGENNWKKISKRDHLDHLLEHVFKHISGVESDEDDLANAVCRALFAMETE